MEMMVDTEAGKSLTWDFSAKEPNLKILPITASNKMYGAGAAAVTVGLVSVKDFKLAGMTVPKISLYAAFHGGTLQNVAGITACRYRRPVGAVPQALPPRRAAA